MKDINKTITKTSIVDTNLGVEQNRNNLSKQCLLWKKLLTEAKFKRLMKIKISGKCVAQVYRIINK